MKIQWNRIKVVTGRPQISGLTNGVFLTELLLRPQ